MSSATDNLYKPSIGMKGLYEVASPYRALLTPYKEYECTAVSSLSDEIRIGNEPLNNIYLSAGDSQLSYTNDVAADMPIVTLTSPYGEVVRFPLRALVKPPLTDTVSWYTVAIVSVLPAIPIDYNLTPVVDIIKERLSGMLGINTPTAYVSTIGTPSLLTKADAGKINKARQGNIDGYKSERVRLATAIQENTELRARIARLEQYILDMKK